MNRFSSDIVSNSNVLLVLICHQCVRRLPNQHFFKSFYFQYSIDDSLPFILNIFLAQAFGVAGTVVITCYGLPWFLLVLGPLVLMYYYIQNYYRRTSR